MTVSQIVTVPVTLGLASVVNSFGSQAGSASGFSYYHDTLAFANTTVFAYAQGKIVSHRNFFERKKLDRYTRRCFVMTRTVEQFDKFARSRANRRGTIHCRWKSGSSFPVIAICAK